MDSCHVTLHSSNRPYCFGAGSAFGPAAGRGRPALRSLAVSILGLLWKSETPHVSYNIYNIFPRHSPLDTGSGFQYFTFGFLLSMLSSEIKSIHFVGICGTAMASVAAAMQEKGFTVTGSDQNVYPPMSTFLAQRKIEVISGYSEKNLARKPDLVVIGNAISRGNPEAEYALEHKLRYCSLPELLKEFFIRGKRSLVVSGTHGKTTTTSLLAWVFEHNGLNPSYLIGGIPNNLGQGARFTDSEWFIIEGDEYDTAFFDKRSKFVHYLPETVILNNLEFDHADIFRDLGEIQTSFRRLAV